MTRAQISQVSGYRRRPEKLIPILLIPWLIVAGIAAAGLATVPPPGKVALVERQAEEHYHHPPGLLHAVATVETGNRRVRVPDGAPGGCSVSPYQIYLRHCGGYAVDYLSVPATAAWAAAWRLWRSAVRCSQPGAPKQCRRCKWALYNSGSKEWCSQVLGALGGES